MTWAFWPPITARPPERPGHTGDFNNDGKVDVSDLGILAANYGTGTGAALTLTPTPRPWAWRPRPRGGIRGTSPSVASAGLPLIAGLLLVGCLVKLDE